MIYLCDFEDSFTYNIFSEIRLIEPDLPIKVVEKDFVYDILESLIDSNEKSVIILGPGPGHPDKYSHLLGVLSRLRQKENIYLMGICLGHQLLAQTQGFEVKHCREPVHGRSLRYQMPAWAQKDLELPNMIEVQHYNSLAVVGRPRTPLKTVNDGEEVLIMFDLRLISYQFHPESIGTSFPQKFFYPVLDFLV